MKKRKKQQKGKKSALQIKKKKIKGREKARFRATKKRNRREKRFADQQKRKVKEAKPKRNFKEDLKVWERNHKDSPKGKSWFQNTTIWFTKTLCTRIYLTAVQDGKMCWRLDNFLGGHMTKMGFWDYEDTAKSNVNVKK